jgi:glycosyltransferase involved in cell wall biosynthesis
MSPHGSIPNALQRIALKQVFDRLIGRRLFGRVDHFHALTAAEESVLLESGASSDRITIIPNGVDIAPLPDADEKARAKKTLGCRSDSFVCLFMARLHPDKGLDLLLDACKKAASNLPNLELVVAGPDDGALADAKTQIRGTAIEGRVHFTGFISGDKKREAFAAADLFVSLSRYETLPVTVLEAMAGGAPVLVSDAAKVAGVLERGAGWVVPTGDAMPAAEKIEQLANDPEALQVAKQAGRALVEDKYGWEKVVSAYEELYCKIVNP